MGRSSYICQKRPGYIEITEAPCLSGTKWQKLICYIHEVFIIDCLRTLPLRTQPIGRATVFEKISHMLERKRCGGPHSCNWMLRIRSDTHHLTSNSLARTNHMDPHKERKLWRAICVQKSKSQVYFLYNVSNCCTLLGVNSDFRTKIGRFLIVIYEFPLCWILQS